MVGFHLELVQQNGRFGQAKVDQSFPRSCGTAIVDEMQGEIKDLILVWVDDVALTKPMCVVVNQMDAVALPKL